MGAIACTFLALLRPGDHVVASRWLGGASRTFLEHELPQCSVDVTFIDPDAARAWRRATRGTTRVVFLESPVDPSLRIIDMRPARMLAQELGIALIVDATLASPMLFRPLEHGADVVVHTSSVLLSGDPLSPAGIVSGSGAVIDEVRIKATRWGQTACASSLRSLRSGLDGAHERIQRQSVSAQQLAEWASSQSTIRAVHYAGLATHPDHALATTLFSHFGGTLCIDVADGELGATQLVSRLRLFANSTSNGGVHSVASALMAEGAPQFVGDGRVRLGIGLEDPADLIADLSNALG